MAQFPKLKTGAVAQYPSDRSNEYATTVLRFTGGGEQRFLRWGAPLKRWSLRFSRLEEEELFAIEEFFRAERASAGEFDFIDPWDNTHYAHCSFESDLLGMDFPDIRAARTFIVVRENR